MQGEKDYREHEVQREDCEVNFSQIFLQRAQQIQEQIPQQSCNATQKS